MPIELQDVRCISVGDTDKISVDFTDTLDSGESLSTAAFAEVTTADLTLASAAVNTAAYTDAHRGTTVAIGAAAQCTVSGALAGTAYRIRCTVTTDASRTLVRDLRLSAV